VSGTVDEVLDNQSFKASTSASRSFGFSTLHTAVTTLGKSTGIGVQKPESFANPFSYSYVVTPYICGACPLPPGDALCLIGRASGLHGAGADPATADMNHETQYVSDRHQSTTVRLSKND